MSGILGWSQATARWSCPPQPMEIFFLLSSFFGSELSQPIHMYCNVTFWIEESCSVSGLKPTKISIWSKFTENRLQPKRFLEMQTIYFLESSNSYFGAQLCNIGNCFGLFKKWTNVIGTYLVVISTISILPASVFFYLFLNLKPHTNIEASRNSPTCDHC